MPREKQRTSRRWLTRTAHAIVWPGHAVVRCGTSSETAEDPASSFCFRPPFVASENLIADCDATENSFRPLCQSPFSRAMAILRQFPCIPKLSVPAALSACCVEDQPQQSARVMRCGWSRTTQPRSHQQLQNAPNRILSRNGPLTTEEFVGFIIQACRRAWNSHCKPRQKNRRNANEPSFIDISSSNACPLERP